VLDDETEAAIEAALGANHRSRRGIARDQGVARGTVDAIANGRRPADLARQRRRERQPSYRVPKSPMRCPGCGRLIEMPCPACRDEIAVKGRRGPGLPEEPLTIALRNEDERRYLELRRRREQEFLDRVFDAASDRATDEDPDELPTAAELRELEGTNGPTSGGDSPVDAD
jgi:hypothetical protein